MSGEAPAFGSPCTPCLHHPNSTHRLTQRAAGKMPAARSLNPLSCRHFRTMARDGIEPPTRGFSDLGRGRVGDSLPRERGAWRGSEVGGGSLYPSLDMADSSATGGVLNGARFSAHIERQAIQRVPYITVEDHCDGHSLRGLKAGAARLSHPAELCSRMSRQPARGALLTNSSNVTINCASPFE